MNQISSVIRRSIIYSKYSANRCFSSYPLHSVVGMPALSPTMTAGTIGKWHCKVGDFIKAGETFAEVETDKASMAFEAQDEAYIAKLLVESGTEVAVGTPILITVENSEDVSAFEKYTAASSPSASASPPPSQPVAESPKPVPVAEVKVAVPSPKPTPSIEKPVQTAPKSTQAAPVPQKPAASSKPVGVARIFQWGNGVAKTPLSKKLSKGQSAYIEKYGRALHLPIKE